MKRLRKKSEVLIGILGGTGFYDLLEKSRRVEIKTPYGKPSDRVMLGEYKGRKIAFLPRHGTKHKFPPHRIPYKANIYAFKKLGVKRILAPCASGSLKPQVKPGDFVICDQFVDRTKDRDDTYFNGPKVAHIAGADPYCPRLRELAYKCARQLKIPVHKKGTVVVINGPRFSTRSESRWFSSQGWEVINMTQYPENILAREQEMCYVSIALITDYDVGLRGSSRIRPVTTEEVLRTFKENNLKVKKLILKMIGEMPEERDCECQRALEGAFIS